jgi:methylmalonyl-CoA mutase N-terminal domain/subunit
MLSSRKDQYWSGKAKEVSAKRKKTAAVFDRRTLRDMKAGYDRWLKEVYTPWVGGAPETKERFETASGLPLKPVYTPDDIASLSQSDLALPGVYPYTRGVYPSMYRGRQWTMRMFSGFGTPEDTNKRLKLLLAHGETGLSIAFDMPTLYGQDCDSEQAHGEVGRCGVNVSSLRDMEAIFDGIPLDKVSTSMTINAPAAVLTAMYAGVAKQRGIPLQSLRGRSRRTC